MHAALDVNIPSYASAIVTTSEVVTVFQRSLKSQRRIYGNGKDCNGPDEGSPDS
jgi:hypothetical protein